MPTMQMNRVLAHLRQAAQRCDVDGLSDAQLLERFIADAEEAAYAGLVRRHAGMVLGVCRRILGHQQDAEDAFQATFLVLVRKAASVQPRGMVGNWLYGVAYQTALKARAGVIKRHGWERPLNADVPEPTLPRRDLQAVLDQELTRLPDKFRVPLVLCDLEGSTRKEAAQQLGWPEGTLSSRLARARTMLAKRLTRHGLMFSGGLLATVLAQQTTAAAPTCLQASTVQAALLFAAGPTSATAGMISVNVAVLTEGVLQAMWLTKLKFASFVVLAAATLVGMSGGLITMHAQAGKTPGAAPETTAVALQKKPGVDPPPAQAAEVRGTVAAIDAKRINITIPPTKKGDPGEDKILDLPKDVKVFFDDGKSLKPAAFRPGNFADLKVGAAVSAELSADQKQVVALRVQSPTVGGILKAIDAEKNMLTLALHKKGDDDQELSFSLARDTKIFIEAKEASFNELAVDMLVTVKLSGDQKAVGTVQAQWPSVQGVLRAVDVQKNTISLATPMKGDPDAETVYSVAKDAKVFVYARETKLKDLPKESTVNLKLMGSPKEVGVIQTTGPTVQGVLKSVDATNNSVTVMVFSKIKAEEEKKFHLVKDAPIGLPEGKTGALADLQKERPVTLWLSTDQTQVVSVLQTKKGK